MPRIWWSPRWDEFYILAEPFVSRLDNTEDLPGDAVELQPASGVTLSPADAKWLCDWLHGENVDHDYDRVHQLLEVDDV